MNRLSELSPAKRYAIAVAIVAVATLVRTALTPLVGVKLPFVTFVPAVAAAAWLGLGPGIFALALSCVVGDWLFLEPTNTLSLLGGKTDALTTAVGFMMAGGIIVALTSGFSRVYERSLAESREAARRGEFLRVTLQSIGDGVITTDAAGRVTLLNAVAEHLTGWNLAEATGRPLADVFNIINERTRQRVENPVQRVLQTGCVVGLANHTVLIAKDGAERPIDDSAAPILSEHGEILGVVLVFHDATQARNAHAAMEKLAAIVEHSDDAVISKAIDGTITSWNAAAEQLYGYAAEEVIGEHISIIIPKTHRGELDEIMQQMKRGERIDHWDTVRRRKDGTLVDVSLRISPIKNAYGEVVGASKVAREITERKRAEAALTFLAKTSAQLSTLMDCESALQQAANAMLPFFADWCVIYLPSADDLGNPVSAHRDPAKRDILQRFAKGYLEFEDSPSITLEAWRTGKTQWVAQMPGDLRTKVASRPDLAAGLEALDPRSIISVPLQIRNRRLGVISLVRSDPARPYVGSDVPLAEDLARRVSIAIGNAQLFQSLRTADKQKDEFLAMLAHELRNPLAAISYAVAAARLSEAEPNAAMMDLIDRQVTNLARPIDDLLDMSRISGDKIQLRCETIDLATIIRRAADAVRALMEEKRHELIVETPPEPIPMYVDPTRAEQIIVNLLTNAAKYTSEGGRIELRAVCHNGEALIKVQDNGIGIAREMLPYVFELFAQADRTLDRSQGGLGIGLTVVRKLAEMHGGSVSAYSAGVGHGSEFTVRLPMRSAAAADVMTNDKPKIAQQLKKLRVLVVEDNRDTAKVQELLLRKYGYEVRVAHDGQAGLEEAQTFRPHAVLVDIGLPVINGYELASRLRQEGFTRELLVAVSGYGQHEDRERSQDAGFDHHLVKPVNHEDLLALLHDVEPQDAAST